ncbi:MAG TPA: MbnP family protein [Polyangiaceae bacterium]|nr:MbnP family protein [Polyangiaceae bacterium]
MTPRWITPLLVSGALACSGQGQAPGPSATANGGIGGSAGAAGDVGSGAAGSGATGGDATGGGAGTPAACPGPSPVSLPLASSGRVDLPVTITINGAPAEVGAAGAGRDGREYRLSLFKFFLSESALIQSDGQEIPAQLLTAQGTPAPYGVHLVDADDPTTQLVRLSTAMGTYTALRLGVGVPAACNAIRGTDQVYPLNPDSDMFWTWGSQFMFIRIEGSTRPGIDGEWSPFLYHVGFNPAFASLTIPGAITAGSTSTGPTLSLDLDLMLATGGEPLPSPKHSVPDGWVVDNLENNQAFTLK